MVVDLALIASLITPGILRLGDATPNYNAATAPAGWGAPNATRASVDKFFVTLSYPGRPGYTWETTGDLQGPWATGLFQISAGDIAGVMPGCSCSIKSQPAFVSGCLNISVKAVSYQTVQRKLTNYTIQLTSALPDCGFVFVRKEGDWVNVTPQGEIVGGGWRWQALSTLDSYSDWKLEVNGVTIQSGQVLSDVVNQTNVSKEVAIVVATGQLTVFVTGTERQAWSDAVAKLLNKQGGDCGCDPCLGGVSYPFPADDCEDGKLAFIGQQLDILEGTVPDTFGTGIPVNCDTGSIILKRIQAGLKKWQS